MSLLPVYVPEELYLQAVAWLSTQLPNPKDPGRQTASVPEPPQPSEPAEPRPDAAATGDGPAPPPAAPPAPKPTSRDRTKYLYRRAEKTGRPNREQLETYRAAFALWFETETTPTAKAAVTEPEILQAYNAWAEEHRDIGADQLSVERLRAYVGKLPGATHVRIRKGTGGTQPARWLGVRLGQPKPQQPKVEEPAEEPQPPVEAPPQVKPEEPQPKLRVVVQGDEAYLADTDRPGREIPKEYAELVNKILDSGKGWAYRKANPRGQGKPRLYPPAGRPFTLPNTPSDQRGLLNTRAALRRLGAAV